MRVFDMASLNSVRACPCKYVASQRTTAPGSVVSFISFRIVAWHTVSKALDRSRATRTVLCADLR